MTVEAEEAHETSAFSCNNAVATQKFTSVFTKAPFPVPGTAGPHTQNHLSVSQILTPTIRSCPQPVLSSSSFFTMLLCWRWILFTKVLRCIFLKCWTIEDGTDMLFRNFGERNNQRTLIIPYNSKDLSYNFAQFSHKSSHFATSQSFLHSWYT